MSFSTTSGVARYLTHCEANLNGRPAFDPYRLFAAILFAFSLGYPSLREIESFSKYDLRFIYFLGSIAPDHSTIGRFINQSIKPNIDKIFSCITQEIFDRFDVTVDTVFIDGKKQQAKSNKYKFVWKPTYYYEKLCGKVRSLLQQLNLSSNIPSEGIFSSKLMLKKIDELSRTPLSSLKLTEKAAVSVKRSLYEYLEKFLEYEEKERICGERNSYYKTDHDATAMCLKEDYYSGLGSNMHTVYNVQILISYGLIVSVYVSQDRSDTLTLRPAVRHFQDMYGHTPERLVADAGYGSLSNYEFCEENAIRAFIKYGAWAGESSGRYPALYEYLNDGTITCLGNQKGYPIRILGWHPRKKGSLLFQVKNCDGCEFMRYCRRLNKESEGSERYFEIKPRYAILKQEARDRLLSKKGIEMRINRSCQVEGAFCDIKNNHSYDRFRRTRLERVRLEFKLNALGFNIRKFLKYAKVGTLPEYWSAPVDLEPGQFKKPSAKRIERRMSRINKKQPNEIARSSYR